MGDLTNIDAAVFDLGIDRHILSEYLRPWAVKEDEFGTLVGHAQTVNWREHLARHQSTHDPLDSNARGDAETPYALSGGVAQIEVVGAMMKYASSIGSSASTVRIRKQIRHAIRNDAVQTILFRFDTPGGTVSGTKDLADEIAKATQAKRTVAFVDDLCASAGYWAASQCHEIIANNSTALIGSIGTYSVVYDMSQQAAQLGIKVHVVGAGKFKGAGVAGTEITPDQLENWQRIITALNDEFKTAVAAGRSLASATMDELADGRVHPANVALDLGLIDKIQSFEQAISTYHETGSFTVTKPAANESSQTALKTDFEPKQPAQASVAEIKAICPDADFVLEQFEAGATIEQATAAYNKKLKAENEALVARHEEELAQVRLDASQQARQETIEANAAAAGVEPMKMDDNASSAENEDDFAINAELDFSQKVEATMNKMSDRIPADEKRQRAISQVARANPQLHQAYLKATNSGKKRSRLIEEKYETV